MMPACSGAIVYLKGTKRGFAHFWPTSWLRGGRNDFGEGRGTPHNFHLYLSSFWGAMTPQLLLFPPVVPSEASCDALLSKLAPNVLSCAAAISSYSWERKTRSGAECWWQYHTFATLKKVLWVGYERPKRPCICLFFPAQVTDKGGDFRFQQSDVWNIKTEWKNRYAT